METEGDEWSWSDLSCGIWRQHEFLLFSPNFFMFLIVYEWLVFFCSQGFLENLIIVNACWFFNNNFEVIWFHCFNLSLFVIEIIKRPVNCPDWFHIARLRLKILTLEFLIIIENHKWRVLLHNIGSNLA